MPGTSVVAPLLAKEGRIIDSHRTPHAKPLERWHMAFADALAVLPKRPRPSVPQQIQLASELAGKPISYREIRLLRYHHLGYREYVKLLQSADWLQAARKRVEQMILQGMDVHHQGMLLALAARDYKTIPAYTVPLLDRAMPKRDGPAAVTQVNITLSPRQQEALAALETPSLVVEAEVVEDATAESA